MVDLGKYAFEVLLAYGISIACLVALVAQSVAQSRRVRARLLAEEDLRRGDE